jgi:phosphoglycolate phosphatase-like HAD superfamily hydrolase
VPSTPRSSVEHVVWDWNGTLLDDFGLTAEIATRTLAQLGAPGITGDDIRHHFRRPFSDFYASLLGRPVSAHEFSLIRERYETEYDEAVLSVPLQADAGAAMDYAAARGTQSLLSMAPDPQLQQLVDHHHIRERFLRVEGSPTASSDGNKAGRLCEHLSAIGAAGARTVVIGDTVDDHEAAQANGARSVLVTTGSTSRAPLERTGAPVVDTVLDAIVVAHEN